MPPPIWPTGVFRHAARAIVRRARPLMARLTVGLAGLGEQIGYRRQELALLALLAASVLGGFAIQTWRDRAPELLLRFEAEPPRPADAAHDAPVRRSPAGAARPKPAFRPTPDTPLDLNRATAPELMRLPGIGPRLASRILAERQALGGRFASADDLARVPGLGRGRLAALRPLVTAKSREEPHRAGGAGEPP